MSLIKSQQKSYRKSQKCLVEAAVIAGAEVAAEVTIIDGVGHHPGVEEVEAIAEAADMSSIIHRTRRSTLPSSGGALERAT